MLEQISKRDESRMQDMSKKDRESSGSSSSHTRLSLVFYKSESPTSHISRGLQPIETPSATLKIIPAASSGTHKSQDRSKSLGSDSSSGRRKVIPITNNQPNKQEQNERTQIRHASPLLPKI